MPPARLRLIGAVASAVLVVTAVVLAIVGGSSDKETTAVATPAHLVGIADLTALEDELGHSVYWAGERPPARLELKAEAEGSVYLRYLPPGGRAGSKPAAYLTIGTYPVADAQAAVRNAARQAGAEISHVAAGGIVLANPESEGSVYLAYPGADLQLEVYDPHPGRALALIRSGVIRPVGE